MGLAFLALSKYEAVPVVMVIAAAVLLVFLPRIRRNRNAAALDVSLFALPPTLAYVFWLTYNKHILGSWLAFLHVADATQGAGGETPAAAVTPPTTPTPVVQCVGNGAHDESVQAAKCSLPGTADFLLHNLLAFGPVLLLLVLLLLLSSGWKPTPTSSSAPIRPNMCTSPRVGSVMRESTLSRVDFPAPLRPMIPTMSPSATSKLTSRSAENVSTVPSSGRPKRSRTARVSASAADTDRGA